MLVMMNKSFTKRELTFQNILLLGTGGLSAENRQSGFVPVFLDTERSEVHPSCYANGQPANIHILDGLPEHLILANEASGAVSKVKKSVIPGFLRDGHFYTREEAADAVQNELTCNNPISVA